MKLDTKTNKKKKNLIIICNFYCSIDAQAPKIKLAVRLVIVYLFNSYK